MGSQVEINDTLQITLEQGFPGEVFDREKHQKNPVTLGDVQGRIFEFHDKPGARIYQSDPVRVYFVQNINDKWLFWGRIFIQSQHIEKKISVGVPWTGEWITSGTYKIIDVYDPEYQEIFTRREAPLGHNYFS
jgi:hypothetical protein